MPRGFTFIELALLTALIAGIAALAIPVGVHFYTTQVLDDTTNNILVTIRRAQNQAVFQKNDSTFGIAFFPDSYVLFQGNSYAARTQNEDEIFLLEGGVTASGISEIVFAKQTGIPSTSGSIIIASGNTAQGIHISAYGKIERE